MILYNNYIHFKLIHVSNTHTLFNDQIKCISWQTTAIKFIINIVGVHRWQSSIQTNTEGPQIYKKNVEININTQSNQITLPYICALSFFSPTTFSASFGESIRGSTTRWLGVVNHRLFNFCGSFYLPSLFATFKIVIWIAKTATHRAVSNPLQNKHSINLEWNSAIIRRPMTDCGRNFEKSRVKIVYVFVLALWHAWHCAMCAFVAFKCCAFVIPRPLFSMRRWEIIQFIKQMRFEFIVGFWFFRFGDYPMMDF